MCSCPLNIYLYYSVFSKLYHTFLCISNLYNYISTPNPCRVVARLARVTQHGRLKKFNYRPKTARIAQGIQPRKATIKVFRIRMNIDAGRIVCVRRFSRSYLNCGCPDFWEFGIWILLRDFFFVFKVIWPVLITPLTLLLSSLIFVKLVTTNSKSVPLTSYLPKVDVDVNIFEPIFAGYSHSVSFWSLNTNLIKVSPS